jgi:hypothetical protein
MVKLGIYHNLCWLSLLCICLSQLSACGASLIYYPPIAKDMPDNKLAIIHKLDIHEESEDLHRRTIFEDLEGNVNTYSFFSYAKEFKNMDSSDSYAFSKWRLGGVDDDIKLLPGTYEFRLAYSLFKVGYNIGTYHAHGETTVLLDAKAGSVYILKCSIDNKGTYATAKFWFDNEMN